MTSYIALLRAVNVGGTGKLAMEDLKTMCEADGFRSVRTYIASGNVVLESPLSEKAVKKRLESIGLREIYVRYGENMGRSKLKIPAGKNGTARNMNTIAKLSSMASA